MDFQHFRCVAHNIANFAEVGIATLHKFVRQLLLHGLGPHLRGRHLVLYCCGHQSVHILLILNQFSLVSQIILSRSFCILLLDPGSALSHLDFILLLDINYGHIFHLIIRTFSTVMERVYVDISAIREICRILILTKLLMFLIDTVFNGYNFRTAVCLLYITRRFVLG